jgi:glycosyltransferase involved in cell wall biosynthesis
VGVTPVPWFVANGWVANYQDVISQLPLVLTTSNWVTDTYERDGVDVKNFKTLHIGFDPAEIFPVKKDDKKIVQLKEMLGIPLDRKVILTVGGDVTSKGAQEMFRALKKVNEEFENWHYILKHWDSESAEVHGEEEEVLIDELNLPRDNITYLSGGFSHEFMSYLLSAADIYAAPSRLEGFGMIQVEAQACGVPVISINKGGPADTVIHGQTGYLAEVGQEIQLNEEWAYEGMGFDADHKIKFDKPKVFAYRADTDELAKYTLELLTDDAKREQMGKAAYEHAIKEFHYKKVAEDCLNMLKEKLNLE